MRSIVKKNNLLIVLIIFLLLLFTFGCSLFDWVELKDPDNDDDLNLAPEMNIKQGETDIVSGTGSYDFGSIFLGNSSTVFTFTIENLGNAKLNLIGSPIVGITGDNTSDFNITQPASTIISTSENSTFTITFTPTSVGNRTANVSIANNDLDENPFEFSIIGNAVIWKLVSNDPGIVQQIVSVEDTLLAHADARIYKINFDDLGSLWTECYYSPGNGIMDLDADSGNVYCARQGSSVVMKSINKGENWSYMSVNGADRVTSVDFYNDVGWCAERNYGTYSGPHRCTDGSSFSYKRGDLGSGAIYGYRIIADVVDPTNCAYFRGGSNYRTLNGGTNWTSISYGVYFCDLSGDESVIYGASKYSIDNGNSWLDLGITANIAYNYGTDPFAKDHATGQLFVAKNDGLKGVYVKEGSSWTQYGTEIENIEIDDLNICDTGTDNYLFAVTSTGAIYYSLITE